MKIEISQADTKKVMKIGAAALACVIVIYVVLAVRSHYSHESRCDRSCGERKSEVVNGSCVCADKVGWIKSQDVAQVKQKLEAKAEQVVHHSHKRKKHR